MISLTCPGSQQYLPSTGEPDTSHVNANDLKRVESLLWEVKARALQFGQRRARIAGDEEGVDRTIRRVAPRQAQS
jgi:hypothetical protein